MTKGFSTLACFIVTIAVASTALGDHVDPLVFDGVGVDPNLAFANDNYEPETAVNIQVAILHNVLMKDITLNATDFPFSGLRRYRMGEGFSLTLDNTTFVTSLNGAISGPHRLGEDGNLQNSSASSDFCITNGSLMNMHFMDRGASGSNAEQVVGLPELIQRTLFLGYGWL